jgi:hypothetical protein
LRDRTLRGFQEAIDKELEKMDKNDADISEQEKDEVVRMGQKYSPVFNTISNATPVSAQLDK